MEMLKLESMDAGYEDIPIIKDVNFDADIGDFIGIIGPNGCGKTTLLRAIAGLISIQNGSVKVKGKDVGRYNRKDLAQKIAFVPQMMVPTSGFSVEDTVLLGRTPYMGRFSFESDKDYKIAAKAIEDLKIEELADKSVTQLSGGEFQRVAIARALAQETRILLLDEPISHLDFKFQLKVLRMLKRMRDDKLIISTFHDLTLAARFSRKLLLLSPKGEVIAFGRADTVLTPDNLRAAYKMRLEVRRNPKNGKLRVYTG